MTKTIRLLAVVGVLALLASQAMAIQTIGDPDVGVTGNCGIGTTTPQGRMHTYTNTTGFVDTIILEGAQDPVLGATRMVLKNPNSQLYFQAYGSQGQGILKNAVGLYAYGSRLAIGGGLGREIFFFTDNKYRNMNADMVIKSSGSVGIGTSVPTQRLEVIGNIKGQAVYGTAGSFTGPVSGTTGTFSSTVSGVNGRFTGNVGIGTSSPSTLLDVAGEASVDVINIRGGSDVAERFDIAAKSSQKVEPGTVVCIDAANPGKLVISSRPYDRTIAGIVSGANGLSTGLTLSEKGTLAHGQFPVALTGRVYCMADASNGSIMPGDLLTTSAVPGHAMKVTNHTKGQGAILGKAMTPLAKGKGMILVLVSLQ